MKDYNLLASPYGNYPKTNFEMALGGIRFSLDTLRAEESLMLDTTETKEEFNSRCNIMLIWCNEEELLQLNKLINDYGKYE